MTLLVPDRTVGSATEDVQELEEIVRSPRVNGSGPNGSAGTPASTTHRVVLVVSAVGLFGPALIAWTTIVQLPVIGFVSTLACAASLVVTVLTVTAKTEARLEQIDLVIIGLGVVVMGALAAAELYFQPGYGTDEAAFVQYAAQLLVHGHDPYRANLLPALTHFRVPIQYATYKLNGTMSAGLAYPALSFLLVVPATLLTHGIQSVILANLAALLIEMLLVFAFLPKRFRALSVVLVLGLSFLFNYTIGGVIMTMALPFVLVAAYRWASIGRGGRLGAGGVLRAICLGAAACVTQFPWFVVPFLAVGLWHLRTRELGRRQGGIVVFRFLGLSVLVAAAINAPFVVWGPRAWLSGVLTPLFQKAIPLGQGLDDLTTFLHVGGGNLDFYTAAAVCVAVSLIVAYCFHFDRLRAATFVLPSVAFLFSTRSMSEYFVMMVAAWVVSVLSGEDPRAAALPAPQGIGRQKRGRRDVRRLAIFIPVLRWAALGVPVAAALSSVALALATPQPLSIKIGTIRSNGQFGSIWQIKARVVNTSAHVLQPHFATDASGYMTSFWNALAGPKVLRPGQAATYVLVAPNVGSMPGVTQPFVLQAVTASPDTMSSSSPLTPEPYSAVISPNYVDRLVQLGRPVRLSVQLHSPYGAPVRRAGVPVALGQVIYAQNSLIAGQASINNSPEGMSPVVAVTNARGVASFTITNHTVQQGNPLYFQAYVDPARSFPYGYSEVVSVEWVPHGRARAGATDAHTVTGEG